jgi:hypothetical protein
MQERISDLGSLNYLPKAGCENKCNDSCTLFNIKRKLCDRFAPSMKVSVGATCVFNYPFWSTANTAAVGYSRTDVS